MVRLAYNHSVAERLTLSINARTRYCAVLGHPVRHSASPAMQNAGIAALAKDWRYLAFDVDPNELRQAIDGAKAMKFIGLNLTVPHKLLAVEMVDVIDPRAKKWGAVNTVVFETRKSGKWAPVGTLDASDVGEVRSHGYNTDADAIVQSIQEDFGWKNIRGAAVLLLGAGGAARSCALRLAEEKVGTMYLINRTKEKAQQIGAEIKKENAKVSLRYEYPVGPIDLVINATSLGLKKEDALPIDLDWLKARKPKRVYDMIYRPAETQLLREARKIGCKTANGLGMLLYQGARALELWSGEKAPIKIMRDALVREVHGV
ncbi:MAG: shikimate dehydrogenase [Limisphaerales bacterium]